MDHEKKLFGLMAIAEEHQATAKAALEALAKEREALAAEREAFKRAVAELNATTQGIPLFIQKAANQALQGASEQATKGASKAFKAAGETLRDDLNKVKTTATESAQILNQAVKKFSLKWMLAIGTSAGLCLALVLAMGWGWVEILKVDVTELRVQKAQLEAAGSRIKISNCDGRKCVQIDPKAGTYGENFMVIKGY